MQEINIQSKKNFHNTFNALNKYSRHWKRFGGVGINCDLTCFVYL